MWVVARAKPGMMVTAMANLKRQEFDHYAPQFRDERVTRGKRVVTTKYLFSTYIFIEVADRWRAITNTYGLSRVLCNGGEPERVSQDIIDELRRREGPDGFYRLEPLFIEGQQLRVKANGLLTDRFCVCTGMSSFDRVKVLFTGLGMSMRSTLSIYDVEAA